MTVKHRIYLYSFYPAYPTCLPLQSEYEESNMRNLASICFNTRNSGKAKWLYMGYFGQQTTLELANFVKWTLQLLFGLKRLPMRPKLIIYLHYIKWISMISGECTTNLFPSDSPSAIVQCPTIVVSFVGFTWRSQDFQIWLNSRSMETISSTFFDVDMNATVKRKRDTIQIVVQKVEKPNYCCDAGEKTYNTSSQNCCNNGSPPIWWKK